MGMDSEGRLADILSEFARTMLTDFPIQRILDHLVERIVELMPVDAAGVTLISPGGSPRYISASNGTAMAYERLQTDLGQGPCMDAYASGSRYASRTRRKKSGSPSSCRGRSGRDWRQSSRFPFVTASASSERSTFTDTPPDRWSHRS